MLKVKHKVFNVFRHKWHRNRMVFHNLRIRDYKIKASLFLTLKESWSYQRTIKLKFINLLRSREHSSLETCFSALRDWKITRYTASVKLDPHEKIRAKFLMKRWRALVKKRRLNYKKYEILSIKTDYNCVKNLLREWSSTLYLKNMEENVAIPHF